MPTRVLVDANVLFSRTLRDWLVLIELEGGPYKVCWTEDIMAEVVYRLRRQHPTWDGRTITGVRDRIVRALEGGRIEEYAVDGSFDGDPDDQHVHAAAVAGGVDVVLTADRGLVPPPGASAPPYDVAHPDAFFLAVDDAVPDVVRRVVGRQAEYHARRAGDLDLVGCLQKAGCPRFGRRVARHLRVAGP